MTTLYNSSRWRDEVRPAALERDGHRCTVSRLLGGPCTEGRPLHVHHIVPVDEGGAPYDLDNVGTVCARHHPMWEALRRTLARRVNRPVVPLARCRHQHRYRYGREECERRRRRKQLERERDQGIGRSDVGGGEQLAA